LAALAALDRDHAVDQVADEAGLQVAAARIRQSALQDAGP
jgi:hypothetical protein